MTHAALKDLVKKWRDDAGAGYGYRFALTNCADELSAALSAMEGEAHVEDMVESTDRVTITAPPPQQAVVDRYLAMSMRHFASEDDDGSDCDYLWKQMTQDQRDEANRIVSAAINEVSTHPTPSPGPQGGGEAAADLEHAASVLEAYGEHWLADKVRKAILATPPAHQPGEVDMELVEEGLRYFEMTGDKGDERYPREIRKAFAALAPKEAGHG